MEAAQAYQQSFKTFQEEKAGMSSGSGFMIVMRTEGDGEQEEPESIKASELPAFNYERPGISATSSILFWDIGVLLLFNMLFFTASFVAFLKYDVR